MAIEEQTEEEAQDQTEGAQTEEGQEEGTEEAAPASDELVVSLGEEPEDESAEVQAAPSWVKDVRKRNRQLERELRDLRKQVNDNAAKKKEAEPELGEKPTLEACNYDATKYEADLASWFERKRKADERKAAAENEARTAEQRWKAKLDAFGKAKDNLGADDFAEAESLVLDLLNETQQAIIVSGAKDPALVVYALGKNEDRLRQLAALSDPVEFAFAVARLEGQMKVTGKKPAVAPEERIASSGRSGGAVDNTLARLRAEAEKTGDYTKVAEYKRSHQKK